MAINFLILQVSNESNGAVVIFAYFTWTIILTLIMLNERQNAKGFK